MTDKEWADLKERAMTAGKQSEAHKVILEVVDEVDRLREGFASVNKEWSSFEMQYDWLKNTIEEWCST